MEVVSEGLCVSVCQVDAVYLNGELLTVDADTGMLPQRPIPGVACPSVPVMPAYSYGFFHFSGVALPVCAP